jgi:hypothetical protein
MQRRSGKKNRPKKGRWVGGSAVRELFLLFTCLLFLNMQAAFSSVVAF